MSLLFAIKGNKNKKQTKCGWNFYEPCLKMEIGISSTSIYSLHYLLATTFRAFSLSEFILSYAYLKFISYSRFKNIAKPFSRTCTWQPCQVSIVHALC